MTKRIDIAICERNRLFREGICSILKAAKYRVMAAVADADELEARNFAPDTRTVFLMGERPDGSFDAPAIATLRKNYPEAYVVVLLDACSTEQRWQAEELGVVGVLLKSISGEVLVRSIELVLMGEHVFSAAAMTARGGELSPASDGVVTEFPHRSVQNVTGEVPLRPDEVPAHRAVTSLTSKRQADLSVRRGQLSERELEILDCLVEGSSNKVIARRCNIAEATVKVHLKAILRKIECANRTQAAVWAMNRMKDAPMPMIEVTHLDHPSSRQWISG